MIIANINGQELILESLKDANQLLEILHRAKPVSHDYRGDNFEIYYHPGHTNYLSIEITSAPLVSAEEHQSIVEASRAAAIARQEQTT